MSGRKLLFIDTETTGLTHADRIITLGLVLLDLDALAAGRPSTELRHWIFNPGRASNPFAAVVHGYDDRDLRYQPDFAVHAAEVLPYFSVTDSVFAHNAAFDERFLRTEFGHCGLQLPQPRFSCTLRAYKNRHERPGGLDKILDHMGRKTRGKQHGALEDAWLCMLVHLWLEELPAPDEPHSLDIAPENWVAPEPRPLRGARKIHFG